MQMRNCSKRVGLTLIETLVSVTIMGILVALLMPAIQRIRESARKTSCQNNLRQNALALHSFHTSNKHLPSHYNGTSLAYPLEESDLFHLHSWRTSLLPYLDHSKLHNSIDFDALATGPENDSAATTVVAVYICPSGASPLTNMGARFRRQGSPTAQQPQGDSYEAVRSDYDGLAGIFDLFEQPPAGTLDGDIRYVRWGIWGLPTFGSNQFSDSGVGVPPRFDNQTIFGDLARYREGEFREASDGLTNTIMLVERGGRPLRLKDGSTEAATGDEDYPGQIGWSASAPFVWRINFPDVGVNQDNAQGIYSYHDGGAYVALAGGEVTFLSESTDQATLKQMIGRSDGEN